MCSAEYFTKLLRARQLSRAAGLLTRKIAIDAIESLKLDTLSRIVLVQETSYILRRPDVSLLLPRNRVHRALHITAFHPLFDLQTSPA